MHRFDVSHPYGTLLEHLNALIHSSHGVLCDDASHGCADVSIAVIVRARAFQNVLGKSEGVDDDMCHVADRFLAVSLSARSQSSGPSACATCPQ